MTFSNFVQMAKWMNHSSSSFSSVANSTRLFDGKLETFGQKANLMIFKLYERKFKRRLTATASHSWQHWQHLNNDYDSLDRSVIVLDDLWKTRIFDYAWVTYPLIKSFWLLSHFLSLAQLVDIFTKKPLVKNGLLLPWKLLQ